MRSLFEGWSHTVSGTGGLELADVSTAFGNAPFGGGSHRERPLANTTSASGYLCFDAVRSSY
jgi:hypothetical protein